MSEITDTLFVILFWMFLDLISLITFVKLVKEPRNWTIRIQLESIIAKKYSLISLVIEITGIFFVLYSFSIPWYYHLLGGLGGGYYIQNIYFIEAINLQEIFTILLYYSYFIGLLIIFVKIATKKRIESLTLLEIGELIFLFPGIMLIFGIQFNGRPPMFLLIFVYIRSGYSSGYVLYIIGITVILINGLQFSAYSRFFRK